MPTPKTEPLIPAPEVVETLRSWEIETMFTCMLRFRSVREEALLVLEKSYFNKLGESHLAYLLELIRWLQPKFGESEQIPFTKLADVTLDEAIPRRAGQMGIVTTMTKLTLSF